MATYTGIADASGAFTIPFSANYTGGQKITVTAEKDAAVKTIELFAPSGPTGGGTIQFSGTVVNFPINIGNMTLTGFTGKIQNDAFRVYSNGVSFGLATGLKIDEGVTEIGTTAFYGLNKLKFIELPLSLEIIRSRGLDAQADNSVIEIINIPRVKTIDSNAFDNHQAKYINIGASILSIGSAAIHCGRCLELVVLAIIPPTIASDSFRFIGNQPAMKIKVPAASLAAYQTAANWSAYAARMVGI